MKTYLVAEALELGVELGQMRALPLLVLQLVPSSALALGQELTVRISVWARISVWVSLGDN